MGVKRSQVDESIPLPWLLLGIAPLCTSLFTLKAHSCAQISIPIFLKKKLPFIPVASGVMKKVILEKQWEKVDT